MSLYEVDEIWRQDFDFFEQREAFMCGCEMWRLFSQEPHPGKMNPLFIYARFLRFFMCEHASEFSVPLLPDKVLWIAQMEKELFGLPFDILKCVSFKPGIIRNADFGRQKPGGTWSRKNAAAQGERCDFRMGLCQQVKTLNQFACFHVLPQHVNIWGAISKEGEDVLCAPSIFGVGVFLRNLEGAL